MLMRLLKYFHKTPFWSQLVFGLVAIFALPEIHTITQNENEQETTINQTITASLQNIDEFAVQPFFLSEQYFVSIGQAPQAVVFCEFWAKSYRFDGDDNHPIRAGPFA